MRLTLNKRLQFEAAYRLDYPHLTDRQYEQLLGGLIPRKHFLGSNFEAFFLFSGPVDETTGMIVNVTEIKERIETVLDEGYDHKCLNEDNSSFANQPPTVENIARQLLNDCSALFENSQAKPVACHLIESPDNQATAYADGRVEKHATIEFSAARQTCSPHLTEAENTHLFGQAASKFGHGHHYRLRLTLEGPVLAESGMIFPEVLLRQKTGQLFELFDHKHLNHDLPELAGQPITTEALAAWMFDYLSRELPLARVELSENPWFSVGYDRDGICQANVTNSFRAAHRLHSPMLDDLENKRVYGKCNNPNGHGHRYRVQAGTSGIIDPKSGTLLNLADMVQGVQSSLEELDGCFLDRDIAEFQKIPSTSENIVRLLHSRIESKLDREIARLRLWETEQNRFTLRR